MVWRWSWAVRVCIFCQSSTAACLSGVGDPKADLTDKWLLFTVKFLYYKLGKSQNNFVLFQPFFFVQINFVVQESSSNYDDQEY